MELRRSQARFERLGDLLASDILKRGANEEVSSINVDEDPNVPYERSPNAAIAKKRSIPYSTSEEAKAGGYSLVCLRVYSDAVVLRLTLV
jgi:hypothetical protein